MLIKFLLRLNVDFTHEVYDGFRAGKEMRLVTFRKRLKQC